MRRQSPLCDIRPWMLSLLVLSFSAYAGQAQVAPGRWIKVHEQQPAHAVHFRRQVHGGSAFDSKRGRIVLFGSDTHGADWTNAPLLFDTQRLAWLRPYENDPPDTYSISSEGLPVAGERGEHPWAMHTFGAVEYDPRRDELIVSSFPKHMVPGRFTDALAQLWPRIKRHPTWILDMTSGQWRPLGAEAVHFFPYATAFDSHRAVVVGYRADGVYELSGEPRRWRRVLDRGLLGYHNNAVYDDRHRKVIVMGSHENSNDVIVYDPAGRTQRVMPTPGSRPPRDQHIPMAFHSRLGKTVAVVDRLAPGSHRRQRDENTAETWTYDLAQDRWEQLESATLPFSLGMNYNLEYDPQREILWLVTSEPGGPTSVWGLRL